MKFEDGQQISQIVFEDGEIISIGGGLKNIEQIIVSMEYGQNSHVAWFNVFNDKKELISKWNAALCTGIILRR